MGNKTYDHITNEELLSRYYHDRDNKWLGILLPRFTLLLFGVCMKYLKNEEDAKDSVQQVFLKVINDLPKYEVTNFPSWIYMVAKNNCLMRLRDKKMNYDEWKENLVIEQEPEKKQEHLAKEAMLIKLQEKVAMLKPEQQQCIRYFYLEKKSYQQIAEITGFTQSQVKSYLQNGKRNLEIMMSESENKNPSNDR